MLARLTSLLFDIGTFTVATAYWKVTMITSTHILTLSSLRWKGLHFLLSRINKLNRDFFHWQCFSLVCFLRNQQPRPQGWQVSWIRYIWLNEKRSFTPWGLRIMTLKRWIIVLDLGDFLCRGGTPYDGLYPTGRLPPKGVPFSGFRYVKGSGISLAEVYWKVAKSVIWVCKRAQKG